MPKTIDYLLSSSISPQLLPVGKIKQDPTSSATNMQSQPSAFASMRDNTWAKLSVKIAAEPAVRKKLAVLGDIRG